MEWLGLWRRIGVTYTTELDEPRLYDHTGYLCPYNRQDYREIFANLYVEALGKVK